jgi:hypothetical protein
MNTKSHKIVATQADLEHAAETRAAAKSMAEAIRSLAAEWGGTDRGRIARALNIRYQWVRNVLNTPITKKS